MPLGHVLFGAQAALKRINSIPACSAGRWMQASKGGLSIMRGRACWEQRGDECSGVWSITIQCLFLFWYKLSFAPIKMMGLTKQRNGVLRKAGRDPERSFKVPLCPPDRIRSGQL